MKPCRLLPRSITEVSLDPYAVPLDETSFCDWLADAEPGAVIAYYRGHLAFDRLPEKSTLMIQNRHALVAVADRVMTAAGNGYCFPVQRRLGPNDWLYLVIRASRLRSAPYTPSLMPSTAALGLGANDAPASLSLLAA